MNCKSLSLRTWVIVPFVALVTHATDAHANDPAAADALFQAGKQLISEKKFAEACSKFDASYKLDPTLGTLLNLADCYEKASRFATSWSTWGAAMEQAQRDKDPRVEYAKERRDALTPKLPKVVIQVYGMLPGIDVYWDDAKLPPGVFGTDMPTDILQHKIVVRRDDGAILFEQKVQVREDGKKTEIPIDVVALNREHPRLGPDERPKDNDAPQSPQRNAGLVIGLVGTAALVTAGGLEIGALVKRSSASDAGMCVGSFCTPAGVDAIDSARTYATAGQWIGLAGIVAFSVGTTLFFAAPSPPSTSSSSGHALNVRRQTNSHAPIVSPSKMWVSPWAGPTGGGFVVGGAL